jgi:hypothetical protein
LYRFFPDATTFPFMMATYWPAYFRICSWLI